jgi:hypothetical protein
MSRGLPEGTVPSWHVIGHIGITEVQEGGKVFDGVGRVVVSAERMGGGFEMEAPCSPSRSVFLRRIDWARGRRICSSARLLKTSRLPGQGLAERRRSALERIGSKSGRSLLGCLRRLSTNIRSAGIAVICPKAAIGCMAGLAAQRHSRTFSRAEGYLNAGRKSLHRPLRGRL